MSIIFFFKQKTAYEIGTGDWSSDVCSSDLCSLGGAQDAFDRALSYAQEREQFGRALVEFQANQFRIADMETDQIGRASCRERV